MNNKQIVRFKLYSFSIAQLRLELKSWVRKVPFLFDFYQWRFVFIKEYYRNVVHKIDVCSYVCSRSLCLCDLKGAMAVASDSYFRICKMLQRATHGRHERWKKTWDHVSASCLRVSVGEEIAWLCPPQGCNVRFATGNVPTRWPRKEGVLGSSLSAGLSIRWKVAEIVWNCVSAQLWWKTGFYKPKVWKVSTKFPFCF